MRVIPLLPANTSAAVANAPGASQRIELPATVVLDTNVVLDWLVFRDPSCHLLRDKVVRGSVRWLASKAMGDELAHVLSRGVVNRWAPDHETLWGEWERHVRFLPDSTPALPQQLRCTDPDDQKFIDFALVHRARWLLSRDRAVLKLRKRAAVLGLAILTPEEWSLAV